MSERRVDERPPSGGDGDTAVPVVAEPSLPRAVPVASAVDDERFRALAEHARDSIAEITPEGKFLYVSPAFTEITGFSPDEILGTNALDLVHPEDRAELEAIRSLAFAEESPVRILFRNRHRDGGWRWIDLAGRPYRTDAGELRAVLVSRDVSERVAAELALHEQLEAEREINELSRRLLSLEASDFEDELREGLRAAARLAGAERAEFYFVEPGARGVGGYYQWNAEGIPERDPGDLADAKRRFGWSAGLLMSGQVLHIGRFGDLPAEAEPERASLERDGARSYLALPVLMPGRSLGFLDFFRMREERPWSPVEISRLQLVAEVLGHAVRRLRAERRRHDTDERLRRLTDQAEDTICEMSEDGRLLYLSPNFEKLCGYQRHELAKQSVWDLVHPEDRRRLRERFAERPESSREVSSLTYRIRHRDGDWRWLEATVRRFETSSGERRLAIVVRDVTARHEGQLDLERRLDLERQIAEFSRVLMEEGADGVDAGIRRGLELAGRLAGADRAYLVTSLADERDVPSSFEWLAPGVAPRPHPFGQSDRGRRRWITAQLKGDLVVSIPRVADLTGEAAQAAREDLLEGGIRSYLAVPILSEGQLIGVLGFHCLSQECSWSTHQITVLRLVADLFTGALRRKRSDGRLRDSQRRLLQAQKMEAIGTLAGGIAHDFNNQLTVMLANARFAKAELPSNSEVANALDDLTRAAEHCSQLTRSLLAFSRTTPNASQSLDAAAVLAQAEDLLRPLIPSSIRFVVQAEPGLGCIVGDTTQIQQVLVNLVVNARDAMPDGGALTVGAASRELDREQAAGLGVAGPGRYVELAVRDTGIGMEPAVRARIFDPFFTTKPVGRGTGLGLATAYGIIQQCGGAIAADSEPGRGSTFRVYLPEGEWATEISGPLAPRGRAAGSGTVLLAEDEESVRRAAARMLRSGGYDVLVAADGAEALVLGRQNADRLQALVTDVEMPRLDGVRLARRLTRQRPELPVVFISGTAPPGVALDAADDSFACARFVAKPFDDRQLLEALHALLNE